MYNDRNVIIVDGISIYASEPEIKTPHAHIRNLNASYIVCDMKYD